MPTTSQEFDAILIVGFGGPESREDVLPFLENVTRGRGVPRERLLEVAAHYDHFGGISPINSQVRELIGSLEPELRRHAVSLPIYWGNRNWHPMLAQTMREMADDGVENALAFVLAAYSSYSSCRQYREDLVRAQGEVGPDAPRFSKIRVFYNHPEFIAANADRIRQSLTEFPPESRSSVDFVFTAHSIPMSMARTSSYVTQLQETCRLVAEELQIPKNQWSLAYQSRSGRPQDPWLEPDILDHLRVLNDQGRRNVIIHPIGFLSDHMEVLYDLDEEAKLVCDDLGITMVRSRTVGNHRGFVRMIRELICERIQTAPVEERRSIGLYGPSLDDCPVDCCLPPERPRPTPV